MVIWDPLVRLWHWSLVAIVASNYWIFEGGDDIHIWLGYGLFALLLVRMWWGIWGSNGYARFSDFYPTPARIRHHIYELRTGTTPRASGHNPIGALMILTTLLAVVYLTVTGFLHEEVDALFGNSFLQDSHKWVADALLILAGIHIAGVLVMQGLTGIPLIKTMITGRRND
jgi:cytochrome b